LQFSFAPLEAQVERSHIGSYTVDATRVHAGDDVASCCLKIFSPLRC
jgi:hypothetical protein